MDLNTTDRLILAKLTEGRCTPGYLSSELSKGQPYISQRLKRLKEEELTQVHRGLYGHGNQQNTIVDATSKVKRQSDEKLIEPTTIDQASDTTDSTSQNDPSDADNDNSEKEVVNVELEEVDLTKQSETQDREADRSAEWDPESL